MKNITNDSKDFSSIDWSEIHRRIASTQSVIERGRTTTPEEKKKILQERVLILAEPPDSISPIQESLDAVTFLLAYEQYAIETAFVREVIHLREFTPLPATPAFVLGIINVRGEILSVIDLKQFFDFSDTGLTDLNKVIVIENETMRFGVLADVILGISRIALSSIQAPPSTFTGIRADYLRGVTQERLIILHANKILSDQKISVQES